MKAQEMGLVGIAAEFFADLELAYPKVVFTSGRRDAITQANVMATNIIRSGRGSDWIAQTYAPSPVRGLCILAVQQLTTPLTHDGVAAAIYQVLRVQTDADLARLSRHLGGGAGDCDPKTVSVVAKAWIEYQVTVRGGKVLWTEGGLPMCHCEFALP